jgi:hypothetical protein
MTISSRQKFALVSAAAVAILALSGCSGSAGQSKAEACNSLQNSMSGVASDLSSGLSSVANDPKAATAKLQTISDTFDKSVAKLENAEVKKAAQKADDSLKAMVKAVKDTISDPKNVSALQAAVTPVQTDFTSIGKLCTAK